MTALAISRNLHVPVGVHPESGETMTVLHAVRADVQSLSPATLPPEAQIDFLTDAWRKGLWSGDIIIDDRHMDLAAAIDEVRAGSDLGQMLLERGMRAIEMLREHVSEARGEPS